MSELKAHRILGMNEECANVENDFYLKSEADKVIEELKIKLKVQNSNAERARRLKESYLIDYSEALKRESHHKYKRCLALMNWCGMAVSRYLSEGCLYEIEKNFEQAKDCEKLALYYDKWFDYLFNLAEKFKEAK